MLLNYAIQYFCFFRSGFSGAQCEIENLPCESSPCKFGTCSDKKSFYECSCTDGYTGTNCDIFVGSTSIPVNLSTTYSSISESTGITTMSSNSENNTENTSLSTTIENNATRNITTPTFETTSSSASAIASEGTMPTPYYSYSWKC